jgi:hypothetical protein
MQKYLLGLLFAALLTSYGSAQTNSLPAKWTDDNKVVLESLPAIGQTVSLPIRADLTQNVPDLKIACDKMSNSISTWKISEDRSAFIVTLNRSQNPQMTLKDWEVYINRIISVYLPKL